MGVVGLVPLCLFAGLVVSQSRQSAQRRDALQVEAEAQLLADDLRSTFANWRKALLVLSRNDAFVAWYRDPGARPVLGPEVDAALLQLDQLYPGMVDESCFIDLSGPEQARQVGGVAAAAAELSPDESGAAFFAPTAALAVGEVHQNVPYVSADSGRWVISNSTLVPLDGGSESLVHMETSLESLRVRLRDTIPEGMVAVIVDAEGRALIDSRTIPPIGDTPFPLAEVAAPAPGLRQATVAVGDDATNRNTWTVTVAMAPSAALSGGTLAALAALAGAVLLLTGISVHLLGRTLRRATGRIVQGSVQLDRAAAKLDDLAAALEVASSDVAEQAAALHDASERMDASVQGVSRASGELADSFREVDEAAASAVSVARHAVETSHAGRSRLEQLRATTAEIGEVVDVIDHLATRTRLLALNASIESAHAGESGRGFAVVANEVKELAGRTSASTSDVGARVEAIGREVNGMEVAIEGLDRIVTDVEYTHSRISVAMTQQTAAAEEIGRQMGDLGAESRVVAQGVDVVRAASGTARHHARRAAEAVTELRATVQDLQAAAVILDPGQAAAAQGRARRERQADGADRPAAQRR
ncbi:MAG: methyl-accepting chemotaxis protein [Acidimicrobiia bacterium]